MTEPLSSQASKETKKVTISHLDGTLLRSKSFFPYYMLVALEAGGPLRGFLFLMLCPVAWLIARFVSEAMAIQVQVFVATAGLKIAEVRAVAKAVLPKFYLEDLEPGAYKAFLASSSRCAITSHPKVFVEHFLKTHLLVDAVIATELHITNSGLCTGFVAKSGVLDEGKKVKAVKLYFNDTRPHAGLCNKTSRHPFLSYCEEVIILPKSKSCETVPREQFLTPLVFHDGRLVMRPTPFASVAIFLWIPIGLILAIVRIAAGLSLPAELAYPVTSFLGLKLRVKGAPPLLQGGGALKKEGVLFVCTHRTLADPTFLTMALRRKVRALAYSVSKVSELIAPIKATRLTRNREEDSKIIDKLLIREDLFVCPEGTTCREPFLLRFSPLFADLADRIVPVALNVKMSMFQGTTARGYKFLDGFFFLMNPRPSYEVIFLDPLPIEELRASGKTAIEIANSVQKQLAGELGYQCTNFNRKDKYTLLAGHDGSVQ